MGMNYLNIKGMWLEYEWKAFRATHHVGVSTVM